MTAPSSPARIVWSWSEVSDARFTGSCRLGRISVAGEKNPDVGAEWVESLSQVESSGCGTFRAQGDDEGVRRRLQDRAPGRHREERDQECGVRHDLARRVERERPYRSQARTRSVCRPCNRIAR